MLLEETFATLQSAVSDREHAWHLLTVATVDDQGNPQARVAVLRGFHAEQRTLVFHTDTRSPKLMEIHRHPGVALLLYDPATRTQLRFSARAQVHYDDRTTASRWSATRAFSKRCYLSPYPPGVALPSGTEHAPYPEYVPSEDATAYRHFAAVVCTFHTLDWLQLCASGHLRYLYRWDTDGRMTAQAIAP